MQTSIQNAFFIYLSTMLFIFSSQIATAQESFDPSQCGHLLNQKRISLLKFPFWRQEFRQLIKLQTKWRKACMRRRPQEATSIDKKIQELQKELSSDFLVAGKSCAQSMNALRDMMADRALLKAEANKIREEFEIVESLCKNQNRQAFKAAYTSLFVRIDNIPPQQIHNQYTKNTSNWPCKIRMERWKALARVGGLLSPLSEAEKMVEKMSASCRRDPLDVFGNKFVVAWDYLEKKTKQSPPQKPSSMLKGRKSKKHAENCNQQMSWINQLEMKDASRAEQFYRAREISHLKRLCDRKRTKFRKFFNAFVTRLSLKKTPPSLLLQDVNISQCRRHTRELQNYVKHSNLSETKRQHAKTYFKILNKACAENNVMKYVRSYQVAYSMLSVPDSKRPPFPFPKPHINMSKCKQYTQALKDYSELVYISEKNSQKIDTYFIRLKNACVERNTRGYVRLHEIMRSTMLAPYRGTRHLEMREKYVCKKVTEQLRKTILKSNLFYKSYREVLKDSYALEVLCLSGHRANYIQTSWKIHQRLKQDKSDIPARLPFKSEKECRVAVQNLYQLNPHKVVLRKNPYICKRYRYAGFAYKQLLRSVRTGIGRTLSHFYSREACLIALDAIKHKFQLKKRSLNFRVLILSAQFKYQTFQMSRNCKNQKLKAARLDQRKLFRIIRNL